MLAGYDVSDNPLNKVEELFAVTECIHIASLALSIGTIAMVDFALLGLGLRGQSPAKLLKSTEMLTLAGLTAVIGSGLAIMSTDPLRYYYSDTFRLKMYLLVAGIVFNYTWHRRMVAQESPSTATRLAALISLAIWIAVIFCGLFFAFAPGGY